MKAHKTCNLPSNQRFEPWRTSNANSADDDGDNSDQTCGKQDGVGPSHRHGDKLLCSLFAEESDERADTGTNEVDQVGPVIRLSRRKK